jgi:hypothetical protein
MLYPAELRARYDHFSSAGKLTQASLGKPDYQFSRCGFSFPCPTTTYRVEERQHFIELCVL